MKFKQIHDTVPYVTEGKLKSIIIQPYDKVALAMPGRHALETDPPGGDFVVRVDDISLGWKSHEFTHTDIFKDVEAKFLTESELTEQLMFDYLLVICGALPKTDWTVVPDPIELYTLQDSVWMGTLHPNTFLEAVQCLAVAEHRRYHRYEHQFGGRFLPFRFAAGIAEGLWTAADAIDKQRRGRPGVEWLERDNGIPKLTAKMKNA